MNEQLRKAIEEATKVETNTCGYCGQTEYVEPEEHLASQAKLLRVIELLVRQKNACNGWYMDESKMDAELIAALEGKP